MNQSVTDSSVNVAISRYPYSSQVIALQLLQLVKQQGETTRCMTYLRDDPPHRELDRIEAATNNVRMASVDLPELPEIVAQLVRSGVYTIYSVAGRTTEYLLVTSTGAIHEMSLRGKISDAPLTKRLSDFSLAQAIDIAAGPPDSSAIQINNA